MNFSGYIEAYLFNACYSKIYYIVTISNKFLWSLRKNLGKLPFKTHKGTQLLHQITCHRSIKSCQLILRKSACLCEPCLQLVGECKDYASLDSFVFRKIVNLPLKNGHEQFDDDEDKEFDEEHAVWEWENSEAVHMIQPNDIGAIWSDDSFNPY